MGGAGGVGDAAQAVEHEEGIDDIADVLVGDEAGRGDDEAFGEGLAIGGVVLVLLELGVAGGEGEGVGEVVALGEVDGAGGLVGTIEADDGVAAGLAGGLCGGGGSIAKDAAGGEYKGGKRDKDNG